MPTKSLHELERMVGDSVQTVSRLRVEPGKVEEFARAIKDDNPIYRDPNVAETHGFDAVPAPLTFTRVGYFPRYRPSTLDGHLGFDLGFRREHVVHGEQEYEFERPVYVGDVLNATTTLVDVYQREGSRGGLMSFAVYETEYRDRDDRLVVTERLTRIETGGIDEGETENDESTDTTDSDESERGDEADSEAHRPDGGSDCTHHADELAVGDPGPEVVVRDLERRDFVKYAGASGDFNPIHYDEPYAKAAGNPSVFAQGMFTAGIASHQVTDWFGIEAIKRFRVRFQSRVWPGDTITAGGEITATEALDDGDGAIMEADIIVTNQDDETVLTGDVTAERSKQR